MLQGVVLFLFNPDGKVLTIREKKNKPAIGKRTGMLSVPMETVEEEESPSEALTRLMSEEVGIRETIQSEYLGRVDFSPAIEGGIHYCALVFRAQCQGSSCPEPKDTDDVEPHGWMWLEELAELGEAGRRELPKLVAMVQQGGKK